MPVLGNSKYERVAQLLALGKSAAIAYAEVYPKTKYADKNVGRFLKMHPEIEQRVSEIMSHRVDETKFVATRAQELAGIDKAFILKGLKEIFERSMQVAPVLDRDGDQIYVEVPGKKAADGTEEQGARVAPAFGFDARAALRALHLMGLDIGMFVQRHTLVNDPFAGLPAHVVAEVLEALSTLRAGRVIEHANRTATAATPAVPQLPR